ncbi:hypothetical protein NUW58_g3468 [Xylaria curta]|uniref:Uncharacterized protein n=1 Tax=Xylaria curta TaxID=42375 RepID=A0ACC1PDH6_9PEZI|nr:hypothetical protein NUW58_g3468 [Xylaria curta]
MESIPQQPVNLQGEASFTKFGALPPELRIIIWQSALPEARTVAIESPYKKHKHTLNSLEEVFTRTLDLEESWRSTAQIPALLHVNIEARNEALRHYTLAFGVGRTQPRVYIDFNRDTVFFGHTELETECWPLWTRTQDLDKIRRLAVVPEGAWRVLRLKNFNLEHLEKLVFVHDSEKVKPGHVPQLVEDEELELELCLELKQHTHQSEATTIASELELASLKKKRMEEARSELSTLKLVLPTEWEKGPVVSTAVFRDNMD